MKIFIVIMIPIEIVIRIDQIVMEIFFTGP
jgi:hypothetical protein